MSGFRSIGSAPGSIRNVDTARPFESRRGISGGPREPLQARAADRKTPEHGLSDLDGVEAAQVLAGMRVAEGSKGGGMTSLAGALDATTQDIQLAVGLGDDGVHVSGRVAREGHVPLPILEVEGPTNGLKRAPSKEREGEGGGSVDTSQEVVELVAGVVNEPERQVPDDGGLDLATVHANEGDVAGGGVDEGVSIRVNVLSGSSVNDDATRVALDVGDGDAPPRRHGNYAPSAVGWTGAAGRSSTSAGAGKSSSGLGKGGTVSSGVSSSRAAL